jgi:hypothetical protein
MAIARLILYAVLSCDVVEVFMALAYVLSALAIFSLVLALTPLDRDIDIYTPFGVWINMPNQGK